ncbi:MAG: DNA primase DnaG [Candidatus Nanohaloarchaeota archaeon QJJ-9]|nr:DNA primase DnaG [Candidatus Nanohaloarchaeota archaeon QJJ-9]
MSKLSQASSKYSIKAEMDANGVVEKPDVVGAIFGQTEGLLGPDLDLRELQMTGRIGRIEVDVSSENGSSRAEIRIPSSLDATETSLIAASLETIDRVGPCTADIEVEVVEDVRVSKRDYIVDRAKELLNNMRESVPESQKISREIKEEVRTSEITEYKGLPAGPNIEDSDSIVVCEGRSDVLNLLRQGVKNVIAIEGTSVPEEIKQLSSKKIVTLFLDGDRGGDLIQKEMMQTVDFDYVARAPDDKEVEELTKKEAYKALREKMSIEQLNSEQESEVEKEEVGEKTEEETEKTQELDLTDKERKLFGKITGELVGTRAAYFVDSNLQTLGKSPIPEAESAADSLDDIYAIVFDGELNDRFVDIAEKNGAEFLVGRSGNAESSEVYCLTGEDL